MIIDWDDCDVRGRRDAREDSRRPRGQGAVCQPDWQATGREDERAAGRLWHWKKSV